MEAWFKDEIERRRTSGNLGIDMMGALDDGQDGRRRRRAPHIGRHAGRQHRHHREFGRQDHRDDRPRTATLAKRIAADVDDEARLAGWCREALRRWPHNPIVSAPGGGATSLADMEIKQGDRIFAWTQAAMLDAEVFPDPQLPASRSPARRLPAFRRRTSSLRRPGRQCLPDPGAGRRLVRRGIKSVGTMQWAGPFPAHLPLRFETVIAMSTRSRHHHRAARSRSCRGRRSRHRRIGKSRPARYQRGTRQA